MSDTVLHSDALAMLKTLDDNSVDSIVTDPPAGINFMNKSFDADRGGRDQWVAWLRDIMIEAKRTLKPGGHALVWALPRTSHWTATALEDAGFEVRDAVFHHFGCLSEDTEILTSNGWEQYQTCVAGSSALCYNVNTNSFGWEPIKEVLTYDYNDTAFRIHSDNTDQLVSRNHRCIVERGGREVFQYAETLQFQESVPILEDLPGLLEALSMQHEGASSEKQDLLNYGMHEGANQQCMAKQAVTDGYMSPVWQTIQTKEQSINQESALLYTHMRGSVSGSKPSICAIPERDSQQGQGWMDAQRDRVSQATHDRSQQSSLEWRSNDLQDTRQLYGSALCEVSSGLSSHVTQGWLRDGASSIRSSGYRASTIENRSSTSYRSRPNEQRTSEPTTLRQQSRSQTVRASRYTSSDLATVTPVHYQGVVWCIRVPSGAFVARRNGKVFVTGNSGFPKSTAIDKQIDKMLGKEREVIGHSATKLQQQEHMHGYTGGWKDKSELGKNMPITKPATPEAAQWAGYGTALKPSTEIWWLVRKPLAESSIAANVLTWGTGGLNIDGCRVQHNEPEGKPSYGPHGKKSGIMGETVMRYRETTAASAQGRWPSHLLLSHSIWCIPQGVKRVRGTAPRGKPSEGQAIQASVTWSLGVHKNTDYADPEGYEQVEAYQCHESCPIAALDQMGGYRKSGTSKPHINRSNAASGFNKNTSKWITNGHEGDEGFVSRYFTNFPPDDYTPFGYFSKASRAERNAGCEALPSPEDRSYNHNYSDWIVDPRHPQGGYPASHSAPLQNSHPTVKSLALMRWLIRLITPPGGVVLDMFGGSGSTAVAAIQEGKHFILIEQDESYTRIAQARIAYAWDEQGVTVQAQEYDCAPDCPIRIIGEQSGITAKSVQGSTGGKSQMFGVNARSRDNGYGDTGTAARYFQHFPPNSLFAECDEEVLA